VAKATVRRTITLPEDLLSAADRAVADGMARSRDDLLAMNSASMAARRRAAIDAEFIGMGGDREYQAESALLEAGLDRSSWEAFQQAETGNE